MSDSVRASQQDDVSSPPKPARMLARCVVAALVAVAVPWPAAAHGRTVSGSIAVPSLTTAVADSAEAARCAWLLGGEASQGALGYVIGIRPGERDGDHRFEISSSAVAATFRVAFYDGMGICETGHAPLRWRGAEGAIPAGATHALVLTTTKVGMWWPCYMLPPLCFTETYASQPAVDFSFVIED